MRCFWTILVALLALVLGRPAFSQEQAKETVKSFTFRKTKQADLAIHVHFPPDWNKEDKRPAIVFFFGGGFQFGDVSQFVPQAAYFASRGLVAARADYRVKSRHGVEPDACVEDAKSAVRWLRQNAARLGLDPDRMVACGSSSGGYLAACTACPGSEPEGEDPKISSRANALILVNPFLPFVKEKANWKIVPTLHLTKDTPPTLILFGTKDGLLPRADEFMAKSKEVGHKAEMFLADGVGHGFAGKSPWREKVIQREDEFLAALGYLQGKPTIKVPDADAPAAAKAADKEEGKVAGILIDKKDNWITVKADGEDEPVKYLVGKDSDKKLVEALKTIFNASRVQLTYKKDRDSRQLVSIQKQVLKASGTVTGVVVKVYNDFWIEVKPKDGPSDAYAPNTANYKKKDFMAKLKGLKKGDSVTITFNTDFERHRILTLQKKAKDK